MVTRRSANRVVRQLASSVLPRARRETSATAVDHHTPQNDADRDERHAEQEHLRRDRRGDGDIGPAAGIVARRDGDHNRQCGRKRDRPTTDHRTKRYVKERYRQEHKDLIRTRLPRVIGILSMLERIDIHGHGTAVDDERPRCCAEPLTDSQ